jgi:hypothetical protein
VDYREVVGLTGVLPLDLNVEIRHASPIPIETFGPYRAQVGSFEWTRPSTYPGIDESKQISGARAGGPG